MRSFVLLAALVALASANPFGWTRPETGNLVQGRNFLWQTRFRQQSPIQEFRQQTRGAQIVNPQQQDVNSIYTQDALQSAVAEQTAQEVLEQALLARQRQTIQGIQQLQRQLDVQGVTGSTEQVSTIEAIRNLQKWLQIQQLVAPQILVNSELTRTLETVIRAQLTSDNEVGTRTRNTQAFQTRVQQLIDISNINEIEVEILNQQAIISQLQSQQQLVAEQIQQIQSQQTISSSQLQNAVVELQQQGQRLTLEILARQLVIQQLQQALVQQQQQLHLNKIEKIVSSYYLVEGRLFKYIKLACNSKIKSENKINFTELKNDLQNLPLTSNNNEVSSKAEPTKPREDQFNFEETHLEKENTSENTVSKLFLKNYTKAEYPSSFMDILTQNRYYCIPQVEDFDDSNCHHISFSILSAIHKILTDSKGTNFTIVGRTEGTKVESLVQEAFTMSVPSLEEIEQLPLQGRRDVLFKILTIEDAFLSTLNKFPTEWHTFLISLKYTTSKISLETPLIYSLVIVFIILNYIDQRIGYYRSVDRYKQKFKSFMQKRYPVQDNIPFRVDKNCFYYFLTNDCIVFMQKVVHLFTLNSNETPVNFDKKLIHQMAQIQSVLLHIKYLNALLKFPYPNLIVHQVLDCTFVHNLAKKLKEKSDDSQYLNNFLEDCPTLLAGMNYVLDKLTKEGIVYTEDLS